MQGSLATRLRVLRAERGLTLREAAVMTGVTKETISDLERGLRHPHDPTLAKIAQGYGVPFEELLEEPVPLGDAPREEGQAAQEERRGLSIQEASKLPLVVFELLGLRAARERRGISVDELSFRTGLQTAAISDLESGNRVPDENTVSLLARALDECPRAELIFPPERYNPDTFRDEGTIVMYADQLVTPGGRKLADAIDARVEQRASEQPDAG